jgi:hypothetical protein
MVHMRMGNKDMGGFEDIPGGQGTQITQVKKNGSFAKGQGDK